MSSGQCQHCGSTDIDRDPSRGDAVCTQCGSVLEESVIVTEVQFAQDSHGASRAIGKLVSSEDGVAGGLNLGHRYGLGRESRATTLQNARQNIQLFASKLHLNTRCIDTAFNFYKVALSRKLTKGRKNTHVVAACVYMVCRKEETAHMLLDLSDILQVSVYELGKTYLKLSTALCINTPALDPSLYILRFAHQLEFGNKTHEVAMTASRLVQRMKKDWMHTGRRPSGLCGAALLVAARLHNFNRTVDDVIKVVKVCQATVRKRLAEFGDTPSSHLTLDEFMTIDLEEEQDPPAFKNARKKVHELDDAKLTEIKKQVSELQKLIERALNNSKPKSKHAKYALFTPEDGDASNESTSKPDDNPEQLLSPTENVDKFLMLNAIESINDVISNDVGSDSALSAESPITPLLLNQKDPTSDSGVYSSDATTSSFLLEPEIVAENTDSNDSVEALKKTAEDGSDSNCQLELQGLDDEELDAYIMDTNEYQHKNDLWHKINADYLKEQKEKEEKRAREEEENANKPDQKKKRRRHKRVPIQANTPGEAIEKMLQQRKISFKLDYDVLKNLNPDNVPTGNAETSPVKEPEETPSTRQTVRSRSKPKPKPKPQAPLPFSIKKGMSDIMGNARKKEMLAAITEEQESNAEPPAKMLKLSEVEATEDQIENGMKTDNIDDVQDLDGDDDGEDEIDDYDDEDKNQISAAQLLGYHRDEKLPDYYEYGEFQDDYDD